MLQLFLARTKGSPVAVDGFCDPSLIALSLEVTEDLQSLVNQRLSLIAQGSW